MGIRVTLYDLFAYTIPGGFYIATFFYFGVLLGLVKIDFQTLSNLMATQIIALTIVAYIIGLIFDPLSRPWYFEVFKGKKTFSPSTLDRLNSRSPIKIITGHENAFILLKYIRTQPNNDSDSIDRFNATSIMLRNISFSLLLDSLVTIILIFQTNFYFLNIVLMLVFLGLSVLAGREAVRFHKWFYSSIYESAIAFGLKTDDYLSREKQSRKHKEPGEKSPGS